MPKAAAIQPNEWATTHDNFEPFDIGELNRVVLDYAFIELTMAKRWSRRSALGRACAVIGGCFTVLGLMAAVALALFMLTGAINNEALPPVLWAGVGLSCIGVLGFFVPWALTPYRQWDRTLCGVSVMVAVLALLSLGAALFRTFEAAAPWELAVPCLLLLGVTIGAIVADFRFRTTAKPPPVDLKSLSPEEVKVLLAARHRALRILRSRGVVPYVGFGKLNETPLDTTAG